MCFINMSLPYIFFNDFGYISRQPLLLKPINHKVNYQIQKVK